MLKTLIHAQNVDLTLHNVDGHYKALNNVNFCLKAGEHTGILGANGAGKSTFLRMLAGLIPIDKPHILYDYPKKNLQNSRLVWYYLGKKENSPIMARRMCALVSHTEQEHYSKYMHYLWAEDILLSAFHSGGLEISDIQSKQLIIHMAQQLDITYLLKMPVAALSQGQLRILLLAKALLRRPLVLLLDEYLDGLDTHSRSKIVNILNKIAINTTLIISTHRSQGLIPCVQKILYINNKTICETKPVESKSSYNISLSDHLDKTYSSKQTKEITSHKSFQSNDTHEIISVTNATVYVQRKVILHNLNWALCAGEHWMIHGKNGAGKSTFLRLLASQEYPALGGSVNRYFKRLYPTEQNTTKLEYIQHAIQLISEHEQTHYSYELTALELVLSGKDNVIGIYRKYSELETEYAIDLIKYFGLINLEKRHMSTLSTGQLRRLFIARALMTKPEVLLLDEPFSALDQNTRHKCIESLDNIASQLSIILISHHDDDKLACINRHAKINNGTIEINC